jgi:exopolysaccharide biosynthesis predicted pyruvyltransferase EpsI
MARCTLGKGLCDASEALSTRGSRLAGSTLHLDYELGHCRTRVMGTSSDGGQTVSDPHGAATHGWLQPLRADVEALLARYVGKPVLYVPNPGNAGDALIAVGTFQAFGRAGVPFEVADETADIEGRVVFLGGGGNLVPLYEDTARTLARCVGKASEVVLLPHTVRGHEATLARLDATCTVVCREPESYAHVRAAGPRARTVLAHDMVFHLDVWALLADSELVARGQSLIDEQLADAGLNRAALNALEITDFSRLDREASEARPSSLLDPSDVFAFGTSPVEAPLAAFCFLMTLRQARRIETDRLHVGLAAALLGIPCELRDNNYGKNAAVFAHSLAGRGTSVEFVPSWREACRLARVELARLRREKERLELERWGAETEILRLRERAMAAEDALRSCRDR